MTFDPMASMSPLIVYLDIKSPYAFLSVGPTRDMAASLGTDIDWRPLTLDIPSYLGSARLDDRDRVIESSRTSAQWLEVKYAYRDCRRYAQLTGRTLRGTIKIWDTSRVHIAMMWAQRQGAEVLNRFLDRVYESFWRREADVEDLIVVSRLLAESGADLEDFQSFESGAGRREHDEMQKAIFDAGIFGVPSYVVEGEVFFGREHLPMVGWILSGRREAAPDVAYRSFATDG